MAMELPDTTAELKAHLDAILQDPKNTHLRVRLVETFTAQLADIGKFALEHINLTLTSNREAFTHPLPHLGATPGPCAAGCRTRPSRPNSFATKITPTCAI